MSDFTAGEVSVIFDGDLSKFNESLNRIVQLAEKAGEKASLAFNNSFKPSGAFTAQIGNIKQVETALTNGLNNVSQKSSEAAKRTSSDWIASARDIQKYQIDTANFSVKTSKEIAAVEQHRFDQGVTHLEQTRLGINKIAQEEASLADIKKYQYDQGAIAIEKNVSAQKGSIGAIRQTSQVQDELNTKLQTAQKNIEAFGREVWSIPYRMEHIGRAMFFTLTLPIMAAGRQIVDFSKNYDASMLRVKAITGATAEEFKKLQEMTVDIGRTSYISITEVASALKEVSQAGYGVNDILTMTPAVTRLATANLLTMADATKYTVQTLTVFGLEAKYANYVTDLLTKMSNTAVMKVEDLAESFKMSAPLAKALGITIEELTASLGALSDVGFKGQQSGTATRNIYTRLLGADMKPDTAAGKILEKYNIDITDTMGKMKELRQIVADLRATAITPGELYVLFGARAYAPLLALINSGGDAWKKYDNALKDVKDTNQKLIDQQNSALAGSLKKMINSFEILATKLGAAGLTQQLMNLAKKVTDLAYSIESASPGMKKFIIYTAEFFAALGPALWGIGILTRLVGLFTDMGRTLAGFLLIKSKQIAMNELHRLSEERLNYTLGVQLSQTLGLTSAQIALNTARSAGAGGIAVQGGGAFVESAAGLIGTSMVTGGFTGAATATTGFATALSGLASVLAIAVPVAIGLYTAFQIFKDAISDPVFMEIMGRLGNKIVEIFKTCAGAIKLATEKAKGFFSDMSTSISTTVHNLAEKMGLYGDSIAAKLYQGLEKWLPSFKWLWGIFLPGGILRFPSDMRSSVANTRERINEMFGKKPAEEGFTGYEQHYTKDANGNWIDSFGSKVTFPQGKEPGIRPDWLKPPPMGPKGPPTPAMGEDWERQTEDTLNKIDELSLTSTQYRLKLLDKEIAEKRAAGVDEITIAKFAELSKKKIYQDEADARAAAGAAAAKKIEKIETDLGKRLFVLTHSDTENKIMELDLQKKAYLDAGMDIVDVTKWYNLEIQKLNKETFDAKFKESLDKAKDLLTDLGGHIEDALRNKLTWAMKRDIEGMEAMLSAELTVITGQLQQAAVYWDGIINGLSRNIQDLEDEASLQETLYGDRQKKRDFDRKQKKDKRTEDDLRQNIADVVQEEADKLKENENDLNKIREDALKDRAETQKDYDEKMIEMEKDYQKKIKDINDDMYELQLERPQNNPALTKMIQQIDNGQITSLSQLSGLGSMRLYDKEGYDYVIRYFKEYQKQLDATKEYEEEQVKEKEKLAEDLKKIDDKKIEDEKKNLDEKKKLEEEGPKNIDKAVQGLVDFLDQQAYDKETVALEIEKQNKLQGIREAINLLKARKDMAEADKKSQIDQLEALYKKTESEGKDRISTKKSFWEALMDPEALKKATRDFLKSSTPAEIMVLLAEWNPDWQTQGLSYGEYLINGISEKLKAGALIAPAVDTLIANIQSMLNSSKLTIPMPKIGGSNATSPWTDGGNTPTDSSKKNDVYDWTKQTKVQGINDDGSLYGVGSMGGNKINNFAFYSPEPIGPREARIQSMRVLREGR